MADEGARAGGCGGGVLVHALELERVADEFAQGLELDRLGDEVEGAELERADGGLDAAEGGDDRHRQPGLAGLDVLDELEPIAIGQAHVGEAQAVAALGQQLARSLHRAGAVAGEPHAHQREFEQFADVVLVIDDEHIDGLRAVAAFDGGHGRVWALSTRWAPGPGLASSRSASLASASSRAM